MKKGYPAAVATDTSQKLFLPPLDNKTSIPFPEGETQYLILNFKSLNHK